MSYILSVWPNTEFNLDDLDFDQEYKDDEEGVVPAGGGEEPSEAEYERVLLANLSPSESEEEGEGQEEELPRAKRRKRRGKHSV